MEFDRRAKTGYPDGNGGYVWGIGICWTEEISADGTIALIETVEGHVIISGRVSGRVSGKYGGDFALACERKEVSGNLRAIANDRPQVPCLELLQKWEELVQHESPYWEVN